MSQSSVTAEQKATAMTAATQLLPLALQFLDDSDTTISSTPLPFITSVISIYKKDRKRQNSNGAKPVTNPSSPVDPQRTEFLSALLQLIIRKLEWPQDLEWAAPGEEEDIEGVEVFHEARRVGSNS